jgi:adenylate kinase family enzyme
VIVDRPTSAPDQPSRLPRRLLIIGSGGSGKSTLARHLATALGLPLLHLDRLYWKPGWKEPEPAAWVAHVDELIAGDAWIMDGNYGGTLERRLQRAQMVIWLDLSRWICLWRVLRRRVEYLGQTRPEMPPGCPEHLSLAFLA